MNKPTLQQRGLIRVCGACGGKSWMNGHCLTCDHKRANAPNLTGTINQHINASIKQGFKTP